MFVISIDLWGTLIKSSPLFVEAKVKLTKKYFPADTEHILKAYAETKKELNVIIEATGFQPKEELIFKLLFSKLSGGYYRQLDVKHFHESFVYNYSQLAIENPPEIYADYTKEILSQLSEKGKLVLSSNTMFIDGHTLRFALRKLDILKFFNYVNFSNETRESKPSPKMYSRSDFHIGDNEITDGAGALAAGSKPIIINSNDKTIKDAYNIITQVG